MSEVDQITNETRRLTELCAKYKQDLQDFILRGCKLVSEIEDHESVAKVILTSVVDLQNTEFACAKMMDELASINISKVSESILKAEHTLAKINNNIPTVSDTSINSPEHDSLDDELFNDDLVYLDTKTKFIGVTLEGPQLYETIYMNLSEPLLNVEFLVSNKYNRNLRINTKFLGIDINSSTIGDIVGPNPKKNLVLRFTEY